MRPAPPPRARTTPSSLGPVPRSVWGLLPARWIRALRAFPLAVERGAGPPTIVVAMAHPDDLPAIDDIAFATGMRVRVVPAGPEAVDRAIEEHLGPAWQTGPSRGSPPAPAEPGSAVPRAQSWFRSPRGT